MRVLVVTETGDAWPSGRVRALGYAPEFARAGIDARFLSRLSPRLTRAAFPSGRLAARVGAIGASRAARAANAAYARAQETRIVRAAKAADVVYLVKTTSAPLVARLRRETRARLVYDLNDGVWLSWRGGFAGGRLDEILRTVDAVTCDNRYGLEHARRFNPRGFLVPDPPQVEAFDAARASVRRSADRVVLGWLGSPGTAFNLFAIWEPLERLFAKHDGLELRLVGVGHDRQLLPRFERVRVTTVPAYDQARMVREVLGMDIGLFPLHDVEDSRTRGVLKASVYMAGEACVVASPIGETPDLVRDGETGALAATPEAWVEKLERLVADPARRRALAARGLAHVRTAYSTPACFARLRAALEEVAS